MANHKFQFSAGKEGITQRKIIRYLLSLDDDGFSHLPPLERLKVVGTPAIRMIAKPTLNPIESISRLRAINGRDCIQTVRVGKTRAGYYLLPLGTKQAWNDAMNQGGHHD